jgi:hypothetical protein
VTDVRAREQAAAREAAKVADQAAQAQRGAAAAAALANVTLVTPPEGTHPSNRVVYRELNRRAVADAQRQAQADAEWERANPQQAAMRRHMRQRFPNEGW